MPALQEPHWTLEEVERLIEERPRKSPRYELVDGELLVTPAPTSRHQRIMLRLYRELFAYLERESVGEPLVHPVDVHLTADSYLEPDVLVIPFVDGKPWPGSVQIGTLLLAAEILSPSSARYDRVTKRRFYQRAGVPEYWIVDGDAEMFEVWHPLDERPTIVDDRLVWHPADADTPLELDVAAFFAAIPRD